MFWQPAQTDREMIEPSIRDIELQMFKYRKIEGVHSRISHENKEKVVAICISL